MTTYQITSLKTAYVTMERLIREEYNNNLTLSQRRAASKEITFLGKHYKIYRKAYTSAMKLRLQSSTDTLGVNHRNRVKIWKLVTGNMHF